MVPDLQAKPQDASRRVLLAEDDAVLRELIAEAMRDSGLTVIEVQSADEAKRYLQAGGHADLVFSDVEMPGSMNGIELGRWVRRNHPEMRLILTSGTMAIGARELGIFISKPYRIVDAAGVARRMLDAKRGND
jgi:DNA-binding NtrC family response regulator